MLTAEAFNALLKTLEEPPAHVIFIFATTEPNKIPITILSRCQRHDFRRIGLEGIAGHLRQVCQEASFDISEESLRLLAREAGGSMRDALSLLDQVMVYSEGGITDEEVLDSLGAANRKVIFDISTALLTPDVVKALDLLNELYNQGYDLKRLYVQMVEHFRHLLVVKMGKGAPTLVDVPVHEMALMKQQVENVSIESVNQIFSALFEAEAGVRFSTQTKLALEAIFVKIAQFVPVVSFEDILNKLDSLARRFESKKDLIEPKEVPEVPQTKVPLASQRDDEPAEERKPVEDLGELWQRLLVALNKRYRSLAPNLEKACLTKVGEDFLEITVRGNSFNTARLRDQQSVAAIQTVCEQFFNRKMKIRIVETRKQSRQEGQQGNSDRTRRLKRDALGHPAVTDALEVFKGKVLDVKIL
jgi:DNA polymerase-3 subunit gamma/tau